MIKETMGTSFWSDPVGINNTGYFIIWV